MVLEKTLDSPQDSKEIQPVLLKGDQSWVFIGRTDAEAETPILCPPDAKSRLTGKNPDAGKDRRQKEKGITEMVGWHHGSIDMSLSKLQEMVKDREAWHATVRVPKELDMTQQLNNKYHKIVVRIILNNFSNFCKPV